MIPHHILVKKGDGDNSKRPSSKITNGIVLKSELDLYFIVLNNGAKF
jgi:hypothetical protein